MALVECKECGGQVSDKATACPHCGFPNPEMSGDPPPIFVASAVEPQGADSPPVKKKTRGGCLILFILMLVLFGVISSLDTGKTSSHTSTLQPQPKPDIIDLRERPPLPAGHDPIIADVSVREHTQVSAYRIVKTEDVSFGQVRRFNVRVSLPDHYSKDQIEEISTNITADMTRRQPVNAILIFFYGPNMATNGMFDVARVEWVPNGRWSDADTVQAGDYSTFRYSVTYRQPAVLQQATTVLESSGLTGLLGVPLPKGATLINRTPGDPAVEQDPTEKYEISASDADIAAYFRSEMIKSGWLKRGGSTEYILLFVKGKKMIAVFINSPGGTFSLMGS